MEMVYNQTVASILARNLLWEFQAVWIFVSVDHPRQTPERVVDRRWLIPRICIQPTNNRYSLCTILLRIERQVVDTTESQPPLSNILQEFQMLLPIRNQPVSIRCSCWWVNFVVLGLDARRCWHDRKRVLSTVGT